MEDQDTDDPDKVQKVRDGREDIAERQALLGQARTVQKLDLTEIIGGELVSSLG